MHADEVDTDAELVRRLVAEQHSRWSDLDVTPVLPRGTDNALYRLGAEMVVRLPRRDINVPALLTELEWLPRLAPQLTLSIPIPLATGVAGAGFPFPWAVYRWIDGLPATPDRLADAQETALKNLDAVVKLIRGAR
ncbi:MAG: phosphotransferase, partial [Chloroflexota bacterium]